MIIKALTLSLCAFTLISCGKDWEVVDGRVKKFGEADEVAADPSAAPPPQIRRQGPAAPPRPITNIPFDVPDVINDLPSEKDLKAGAGNPTPIPVDPQEPTVTARPPAEAPANPDSE